MEDADGCEETDCFPGVLCTDVEAPGVGALCGPCPPGYVKDGQKCLGLHQFILGLGRLDRCLRDVPSIDIFVRSTVR